MKFKYKLYGETLRPVISVLVKNNKGEIGYEVLVDSGADICFFDAEIGEALGIDIKKGKMKEVLGVGGKISVYFLHKVVIEVGGWPYEIEAGFMPCVAGHVMHYGIVGQKGFFDKFVVKFDLQKREIELKRK